MASIIKAVQMCAIVSICQGSPSINHFNDAKVRIKKRRMKQLHTPL